MLRTSACLAAMLLVSCRLHPAPAPTTPSAATPPPTFDNPSNGKLTEDNQNEMKPKRRQTKVMPKACRMEGKAQRLATRWFFIEDCMGKT